MPDRENVIRELRDICMFIVGRLGYEKAKKILRTIDETIILLKEQEAVEPKTDDAWPSRIKTCGSCGTCLFAVGDYKPKYCSECGRAVKWK